jgi:hypothetical protein
MSSSDKKKTPTIKLIFNDSLLKSLNKIYYKQNHELMKSVSQEKAIPLETLLKFLDDQKTYTIKHI